MKENNRVLVFDTTLRDGEQAPGASMNQNEKLEIAFALERLGVDIIEAGFPIASPGDFDSVVLVSKNIKKSIICGLARSIKKDIDAAADSLAKAKRKRIHVFLATSKIHMEHKFKKTEDEILQMAIDAAKYARGKADDIEFSPEDASRAEKKFTLSDIEKVCPGVSRDMIRIVLRDLQRLKKVECLGRGPGALWTKRGNTSKRG